MLRRLRDYEGFEIWSRDEHELGRVEDFYFDDEHWTVRYVLVRTGSWLTGRSILLSPMSIARISWDDARLYFKLTEEEIKSAPDADLAQPISRRWEADFNTYYGIPDYWSGPGVWGMWETPIEAGDAADRGTRGQSGSAEGEHLRSLRDVTGYHLDARDGEIGHVDDLFAEDHTWTVRYLLIDTSNWPGGESVLVPRGWIERLDWVNEKVHLDVAREAVLEDAPRYDPSADVDGKYLEQLAESQPDSHAKRP